MEATSTLLLPPPPLYACVFAAIVRDTRGVRLSDQDRLNFFPASPLMSISLVLEGELRLVPEGGDLDAARASVPLPRLFVTSLVDTPTVSWSPGPVLAISVGIYPDAWARLETQATDQCDPAELLQHAFVDENMQAGWAQFCTTLSDAWLKAHTRHETAEWNRLPHLGDWAHALIARASLSGPGHSARALQRRLKRLSGQTKRNLDFFSSFEHLHRLSKTAPNITTAELALEAGYADQSHMGRAVRRATGFSPVQLNRLIETEEAFWCYRLLGERF